MAKGEDTRASSSPSEYAPVAVADPRVLEQMAVLKDFLDDPAGRVSIQGTALDFVLAALWHSTRLVPRLACLFVL